MSRHPQVVGAGSTIIVPGTTPVTPGGTAKGLLYQDGAVANTAANAFWDKTLEQVSVGSVPVDFGGIVPGIFGSYQIQGSNNGHRGYVAYNNSAGTAAKSGVYAVNSAAHYGYLSMASAGVSTTFLVAEADNLLLKSHEVPLQIGTEAATVTTADVYIGTRNNAAATNSIRVRANGSGVEFTRGPAVAYRRVTGNATLVAGEGGLLVAPAAPTTITLPAISAVADGFPIKIQCTTAAGGVNTVTIVGAGGGDVLSARCPVLNTSEASITLTANKTSAIWNVTCLLN